MDENSTSIVNILFPKNNKVKGNIIIVITFINITYLILLMIAFTRDLKVYKDLYDI